jgi:hypothetical protein
MAVRRVKTLLEGAHEVVIGGKPMTISLNVGVLAEPLGTFFSMALDQSGLPVAVPYFEELVGIVDVGFRTVDIVILTMVNSPRPGQYTVRDHDPL